MKTNKIDFELEDLEEVLSVKTSYLTRNIRYGKIKSFGVIAESVNSSNWLPLLDAFINRKIELDFNFTHLETLLAFKTQVTN